MLLPFEWAVLTVDEAKLLKTYIETSTAVHGLSKNYHEMVRVGIFEIYKKLKEFIEARDHYEGELRTFMPDDYAKYDHEHLNFPR